jgi:TolB-like protein
MAEEHAQRRLAAILAADVVGYSRLVEQDEAGTLVALKARRAKVLDPLVARHHGRIFKVAGDGVLIEFASAVNAAQCAIDLQQDMAAANGELPEERRIVLRIGVNLGDVMVEAGDLYRDGVIIAARLEGIAEPGGILLSGSAHDQVKNKIDARFEDLGAQNLKNIAEPVRTYRIAGQAGDVAPRTAASVALAKPSIAVLPFTNIGGDADQRYLSDGITEDIITELSRYRELMVIARNSSFQFRDKSLDMKRIGRELGAEYLVEGSVRKAGNRLRITAQLIEAASGSHLWAERYDRDLTDVFEIQDEVTQAITATLVGQLGRSQADRARRTPTLNWKAYDYVLQGVECINRYQPEQAEVFLHSAIELDPDYAQAHAMLAMAYLYQYFDTLKDETLAASLASAQKAVLLDTDNPYGHAQTGLALMFLGKLNAAEARFDQAILLNPNSVWCAGCRVAWLNRVGRTQDALAALDMMARHDPFLPAWYWELRGVALFVERRYEELIAGMRRKSVMAYPDHAYVAAAYAYLGRDEEARAEVAEVLRKKPDFSIRAYAKQEPYKNSADRNHLLEGMRKAGLPE